MVVFATASPMPPRQQRQQRHPRHPRQRPQRPQRRRTAKTRFVRIPNSISPGTLAAAQVAALHATPTMRARLAAVSRAQTASTSTAAAASRNARRDLNPSALALLGTCASKWKTWTALHLRLLCPPQLNFAPERSPLSRENFALARWHQVAKFAPLACRWTTAFARCAKANNTFWTEPVSMHALTPTWPSVMRILAESAS